MIRMWSTGRRSSGLLSSAIVFKTCHSMGVGQAPLSQRNATAPADTAWRATCLKQAVANISTPSLTDSRIPAPHRILTSTRGLPTRPDDLILDTRPSGSTNALDLSKFLALAYAQVCELPGTPGNPTPSGQDMGRPICLLMWTPRPYGLILDWLT